MNVTILIPETAIPAAVVDPRYMFSAVNEFFKSGGHEPFFKIQLLGLQKEVKLNDGLVSFHPDLLLADVKKTDLIIIPAISGNIKQAIELNKDFLPWFVKQYNDGSEVASLCTGAFLLASTGLLKGKSCSTHWLHANAFREMFPDVNLVGDKVITEHNGLYSSGGATSYWSLLLYLVEKHTSREMAVMVSKFFLLDIEKNSQLPFTIFRGQKEHGDELILAVQDYIEKFYPEKLMVNDLSEKYKLGRRTFERRFKKATANTIVEYIQRVKIEAAKKQFEAVRKTINEVMYNVGYTDTKAFRDIFKKCTSLSPIDYRK